MDFFSAAVGWPSSVPCSAEVRSYDLVVVTLDGKLPDKGGLSLDSVMIALVFFSFFFFFQKGVGIEAGGGGGLCVGGSVLVTKLAGTEENCSVCTSTFFWRGQTSLSLSLSLWAPVNNLKIDLESGKFSPSNNWKEQLLISPTSLTSCLE